MIDIMHKHPGFDLELQCMLVNTYKDERMCLQLHPTAEGHSKPTSRLNLQCSHLGQVDEIHNGKL